jgi:3-hydroxy-9,10-secoandrosta-1,3,5(10)-triene-9,17-dione monooxygenase
MVGDGHKPDANPPAGAGTDSYAAMVARAKTLIPRLRERASGPRNCGGCRPRRSRISTPACFALCS